MSSVVWFDTGFQTGIAFWEGDLSSYRAWDMPHDEAMQWFDEWSQHIEPGELRVGAERITITAQTAKKGDQVLSSVEQIGVLRHLSLQRGFDFTNKQSPSEAKSFGTDKKLKAMGWWTIGSDHARDAGRHMLTDLADRDSDFRVLLSRKMDAMEGGL